MDYHLEKKLRFGTDNEHKSLYRWYIAEIDDGGDKVGRDQIPWGWNQSFTATELVLSDHLTIHTASQEGTLPRREENRKRRIIRARLRPGEPRHDGDWYHKTTYRMFGTDREITDFRLDILPLISAEETEGCTAWGAASYTYDADFRNETTDDTVCFYLMVKPETFERYAARIAIGSADELILVVGGVEGFYSEWSPSISTREIKVLARGNEQVVEMPEGTVYELPRLGPVGEVELHINSTRKHAGTPLGDDVEPQHEPHIRSEALQPASFSAARTTAIDPQVAKFLKQIHLALWILAGLALIIALRS